MNKEKIDNIEQLCKIVAEKRSKFDAAKMALEDAFYVDTKDDQKTIEYFLRRCEKALVIDDSESLIVNDDGSGVYSDAYYGPVKYTWQELLEKINDIQHKKEKQEQKRLTDIELLENVKSGKLSIEDYLKIRNNKDTK